MSPSTGWSMAYEVFIFSHDFAKAFFGDGTNLEKQDRHFWDFNLKDWQYYLAQIVLEPEPLKYLERFLDE